MVTPLLPNRAKLLANGPARHYPKAEEVIKAQPQSPCHPGSLLWLHNDDEEEKVPGTTAESVVPPWISNTIGNSGTK
jgi:hypothetical protein